MFLSYFTHNVIYIWCCSLPYSILFCWFLGYLLFMWHRARCKSYKIWIMIIERKMCILINMPAATDLMVFFMLSGSTVLHKLWSMHGQVFLWYMQILWWWCEFSTVIQSLLWLFLLISTSLDCANCVKSFFNLADFKEPIPLWRMWHLQVKFFILFADNYIS